MDSTRKAIWTNRVLPFVEPSGKAMYFLCPVPAVVDRWNIVDDQRNKTT